MAIMLLIVVLSSINLLRAKLFNQLFCLFPDVVIGFLAGRTPKLDRLFYYRSGTSQMTYDNPDFRPSYSDEFLSSYLSSLTSAERSQYISACDQNTECKFDFALTSKCSSDI